ncbi:hypothetical protein GCM10017653_27270 [Ancylobacter defluvii]|uniref:Phage terminase Nu1 subunit (DNA packaging protein) n=2 Tax=Ancylobacter defluvii TaxID=1282440 RepID=A0A9W6NBI3_9HYPH|nr:hypothetical protein GCM10017653_27270 [Ancylobacter defluvii]
MARLLDITAERVRMLAKDGVLIKTDRGRFDTQASLQNYIRRLRESAARAGRPSQGGDALKAERLRLTSAQAEAQEAKNAVLLGELVPAADVEAKWAEILTDVRAAILAVPGRIAGRMNLSATDITAIDAEIRLALTEAGNADPA